MNKPTFENTVNILVKAYFNDTLEHENCYACAVGNIIAASLNIPFVKRPGEWHELQWECDSPHWYDHIMGHNDNYREFYRQVKATGYSESEIKRIEYSFENSPKGKSKDEWMFNGLMAVIDVLADIHGIDLTQKEEAKKLFQKV